MLNCWMNWMNKLIERRHKGKGVKAYINILEGSKLKCNVRDDIYGNAWRDEVVRHLITFGNLLRIIIRCPVSIGNRVGSMRNRLGLKSHVLDRVSGRIYLCSSSLTRWREQTEMQRDWWGRMSRNKQKGKSLYDLKGQHNRDRLSPLLLDPYQWTMHASWCK